MLDPNKIAFDFLYNLTINDFADCFPFDITKSYVDLKKQWDEGPHYYLYADRKAAGDRFDYRVDALTESVNDVELYDHLRRLERSDDIIEAYKLGKVNHEHAINATGLILMTGTPLKERLSEKTLEMCADRRITHLNGTYVTPEKRKDVHGVPMAPVKPRRLARALRRLAPVTDVDDIDSLFDRVSDLEYRMDAIERGTRAEKFNTIGQRWID